MIESQVPRPHDRTVGGGLVSLLAHATILAAAVAATARTATVERQPYVHGPIVFVPVDESHDAPPARGAALPSAPFAAGVTLAVLSLPPVRIPPPAAGAFDPAASRRRRRLPASCRRPIPCYPQRASSATGSWTNARSCSAILRCATRRS